jgi:hypothetical protein
LRRIITDKNVTECDEFQFDNQNSKGIQQFEIVLLDPEVKKDWEEFWRDIIYFPDGQLDMDQVMLKLHDYHVFMGTAAEVYCTLTGNRISKINTKAEAIIGQIRENENRDIDEAVKEAKEDWEAEHAAVLKLTPEMVLEILNRIYGYHSPLLDQTRDILLGIHADRSAPDAD